MKRVEHKTKIMAIKIKTIDGRAPVVNEKFSDSLEELVFRSYDILTNEGLITVNLYEANSSHSLPYTYVSTDGITDLYVPVFNRI